MSLRLTQPQDVEDVLHNVKVCMDNSPDLLALYNRYIDSAQKMSYGRNRAVFYFDSFVVKLPMNWNGVGDNDWEGSISNAPEEEMGPWHVRYARTRLVMVKNYPVLLMERVQYVNWDELRAIYGKKNVPKWVDCVDCGQVGFNRSGNLVAYDYGYH